MILILARLVRIVLVLLVVRFLLRFLASVAEGYRAADKRGRTTEMVRDRVCDTFLPRARALMATIDGREQYFCSAECRRRAQALSSRPLPT